MGKKGRKSTFPAVPERLPVGIVDNHTHIYPDPVGEPAVSDDAAAPASSGAATLPPVQKVSDDGEWRFPILLDNLLLGMERAGVRAAITSGCEVPSLQYTVDLARRVPNVFAALAIHPNDAAMHAGVREVGPDGLAPREEPHFAISLDDAIAQVAALATDPNVVAVGETGLDYFRTGELGKAAQKESFRAHIALAKELGKPMQIHDRDAHDDVVEILLADGAPERTVFHCFSGDIELARICTEHGWYASFAGPLTYPVNEDLQAAFDAMPDELVLVETDAPYLTPVPYRGHPNAAWAVAYTARYMAERRGVDLGEWCTRLDRNTTEVYGI